jgi:diaminohydroxyphosphoribosylaminopyrimidine deaminase / 5-amino-6-(5-phosphoribosylamino)uracil reductase
MPQNEDVKFMSRCLDLAVRAEGFTYPNPMVGAVIVHKGVIIGEGYHLKAGEAHAEVNAINSVKNKSLLKESTLYVSLEPCSHFGKTPPCSELIISHSIPRIVIGTIDTSGKVSGNGAEQLARAGCDVTAGVLEGECRRINRRFFTWHEKGRPYVTLKWAQSQDGYIDIRRSGGSNTGPNWISGMTERVLVHKWRASEEAILVGAETIRKDYPELNVRYWKGKDPVKLILTRSGNLDKYLSGSETNGTVIVFTENADAETENAGKVLLRKDIASAVQILDHLYTMGIQSVFIEGGAEVLNHFISEGLWDEARIFTGKKDFCEGVLAPAVEGRSCSQVDFGKSRLEVIFNE